MNSIENKNADNSKVPAKFDAVIYLRRSTKKTSTDDKQQNSLEVQRAAVTDFANRFGYNIVREFVDEASGRDNERPGLLAALDFAVSNDLFVIAYRVDRISRSVSFFKTLEGAGLERLLFQEIGNRPIDPFILSILLAVAEQSSRATSARVKSTHKFLREKLGSDYKVGNPRLDEARVLALEVRQSRARAFNKKMYDFIRELRGAGYTTLQQIADRLNSLGITTIRGKAFTTNSVRHVFQYGKKVDIIEVATT